MLYISLISGSEDQEVDDSAAQDNFEDKLKEAIEGTSEKRFISQ